MNLNNESIKKIRGLILFTALIVIGLWKYEIVLDAVHFLFSIAFPYFGRCDRIHTKCSDEFYGESIFLQSMGKE